MRQLEIYTRHKIRFDDNEIRLLDIDQSNDPDNPLGGELRIVSLHQRQKHKTLSYCWMNPTVKYRLELDSSGLEISSSLYDALKTLGGLKAMTVCVGQICINQKDALERSNQILVMKNTYVNSNECFVYLGKSIKDSHSINALIEYIRTH